MRVQWRLPRDNHPERDAPIEVLFECEPRDHRRRRTLKRQEKGGRCGWRPAQAHHQKQRPDDATCGDGSSQPWEILALQRNFRDLGRTQ
jgi:hypothetical protein